MKSACFALASLVFALGLAGSLGTGYGSSYYGGYENYGHGYNYGSYSGYGHKGGKLETTVHVPQIVPVPQPLPLPAYGAVGGADNGGIFSEEGLRKLHNCV